MTEYRSIDGYGNNQENPDWGQAGSPLRRVTRIGYADGLSEPSGQNRPNPRDISNIVLNQIGNIPNRKAATDYLWVWGQFLDHDIGLTEVTSEPLPIPIPQGDPYFDTNSTGTQFFPFTRSEWVADTSGIRQQTNVQSSFVDASNIYGGSEHRTSVLRTNDGTGRLRTGPEGLLPYNTTGEHNAPSNSSKLYLAGDIRANEQLLLTAMHSLWVLEHNRIAHDLWTSNQLGNEMTGDEIFQKARQKVIAQKQVVTYKEYIPLLLGTTPTYTGYDPSVNPQIMNVFSGALFRLGHSQVSSQLLRLDANLEPISEGHIALRDAFFNPKLLTVGGGIEPLLRGATQQVAQETDARTVDELRNFLFGSPGSGGLDLASLNIQRGRDHGLPGYNDVREDFGLARKTSFEDISSDEENVRRLSEIYPTVDDIDVWVGALAEDIVPGALVGELIQTVCMRQFMAMRDGDRFWYQNLYSGEELAEIENTRLSDVIRRNTTIENEIPDNVFIKDK